MAVEDELAYRRFRYGNRRGRTHAIVPSGTGGIHTCLAVDPVTGRTCRRWINWYAPVGGTPRWRHNPRPYGRAGSA